jgi:hypothetical protein
MGKEYEGRGGDKGKEGNTLKEIGKNIRSDFPVALLQNFKNNAVFIQALKREIVWKKSGNVSGRMRRECSGTPSSLLNK